jgi:RNA polymerase sigma factor (sigma-70 family)
MTADVAPPTTSDAAVIDLSLVRPAEFATLFDRHASVIRDYLARRVGPQSAEDLTGETFLVAFSKRDKYDTSRPNALPWLYGIASKLVGQRRRGEVRQLRALARTGVDPVAADHADSVSARVTAQASTRRLAGALAKLTAGERDVLLLAAWADLSYEELAAGLDIPLGTVRSRLSRARAKVRAALEEHTDD